MTGFVYFVRCGEFVKIGFSRKPKTRLRYFATTLPFDFHLARVLPASQGDERKLHRYFATHRHRGEWFRYCPAIEAVMDDGLPFSSLPDMTAGDSMCSQLIDGLGGSTAVATELDLPTTTVASWKSRGSIPAEHWTSLVRAARQRGLEIGYDTLAEAAAAKAEPQRAAS